MRKFLVLVVALGSLGLAGCASDSGPVGPESEYGDMPWNPPQPGEGGGAFGGMLSR